MCVGCEGGCEVGVCWVEGVVGCEGGCECEGVCWGV